MNPSTPLRWVREEWPLSVSLITCVIFLLRGEDLWRGLSTPLSLGLIFIWLFAVVLGSALSVVRHAERVAVRLGEPYGTLILTLLVTSIEVMSISAVMIHGANNPTLVRDTLFSVVMIVLNGMVGLSLLIGGWRHREQQYNFQGANAYLGLILPLAVLSLILPNFTLTTVGPTLSRSQEMFLAVLSVGLYGAFLVMQTGRHRGYFILGPEDKTGHHVQARHTAEWPMRHAILLAAYMLPVVFLAVQLAHPVDYLIETLHAPTPLGGMIMALLVATPEAIGAVRAAGSNHLQRAVNIFLGSVLSTIGLTVPAMLAISELSGRSIVLGLQHTDFVMLLLTLAVSVVTFASGRTNVLQGAVHLLLFAAYLLLIFQD
ncbi:MAG: ionic transporter y4hA [Caulobacteraceae bacterium]